MRYRLWIAISVLMLLSFPMSAEARCGIDAQSTETHPTGEACEHAEFIKNLLWRVHWNDGRYTFHNVPDTGKSNFGVIPCVGCWPTFNNYFFEESGEYSSISWANFVQITYAGTITNNTCSTVATGWRHAYYHTATHQLKS